MKLSTHANGELVSTITVNNIDFNEIAKGIAKAVKLANTMRKFAESLKPQFEEIGNHFDGLSFSQEVNTDHEMTKAITRILPGLMEQLHSFEAISPEQAIINTAGSEFVMWNVSISVTMSPEEEEQFGINALKLLMLRMRTGVIVNKTVTDGSVVYKIVGDTTVSNYMMAALTNISEFKFIVGIAMGAAEGFKEMKQTLADNKQL